MIGKPQKAQEDSILRRNVLVLEVSEVFEIRAGADWGTLSTSPCLTSWGPEAQAPGSRLKGWRVQGWVGALPEDPGRVPLCPAGLHSKQQQRGLGAPRLGPQPGDRKLKEDSWAPVTHICKGAWNVQGEVR